MKYKWHKAATVLCSPFSTVGFLLLFSLHVVISYQVFIPIGNVRDYPKVF